MWKRRAEVLWRVAPGYLVVSTVDGSVVEFGGAAAEVWSALAEPTDLLELSNELATRYAAEPGLVRADVEAFVAELGRRDLAVPLVEAPA